MVTEIEDKEMKEASFEPLFKQTLSTWDIGKALHFSNSGELQNNMWTELQKKWIISSAAK